LPPSASSEHGRKLINQLELELGELTATVAEDATRAEGQGGERPGAPPPRKPVRGPLPAHLPRERVVMPSPSACPCCGGKLSKLGEDITETLEVVPRSWKVVQTVRERFSCRSCETITQPPAPFHPIARGRAGPNLLAMVLEAKYGQHLPLNRQGETYAQEGVELSVSTQADWVGTAAAVLSPLHALIAAHVLAAERLHGDDTTVPLLARGKTVTARLWTYVRDDRPFGGPAPPAAMFYFSRDRTAEHPRRHLASYAGILQADAYAGFGELYRPDRKPEPITEAACWAHPWTAPWVQGHSRRLRYPRSCAAIHSALRRGTSATGPDVSIRSSAPYHFCGLEGRCAQRGWRSSVRPGEPSTAFLPTHSSREGTGMRRLMRRRRSGSPWPRTPVHARAAPRPSVPSCWRSRPRRRSSVDVPSSLRARTNSPDASG
jgi:transposase